VPRTFVDYLFLEPPVFGVFAGRGFGPDGAGCGHGTFTGRGCGCGFGLFGIWLSLLRLLDVDSALCAWLD
jgi:hypothetical protein